MSCLWPLRSGTPCDLVEINRVPAHTWMYHYGFALPALRDTVQPFKHVAGRPHYITKGRGSIHRSVTSGKVCCSAKAASAWGSWVWSCRFVCLREQRTVGSDISTNPPLLWLSRPLLFSASLPDNWNLSWGAERTAGVSCYYANSFCCPWKHGEASWEARDGEAFTALWLFIMLPWSVYCELAWQWTGFIMAAAGGDVGERVVVWDREVGGTDRGASRCYVTLKADQSSASCPTCEICISFDLCISIWWCSKLKRCIMLKCPFLSVYVLNHSFFVFSLRSFALMWWCVLEEAGTH